LSSDLLIELLQTVDAPQGGYAELERYVTGTQPLAFISPESRKALGNRLSRMASNIPALAVSSLVERLRVSGFSDPRAWELFTANDLDQLGADVLGDALTFGNGFVLVWGRDGRPAATVESPRQAAVLRDPADRSVIAGVKRYRTKTETHAYIYLPDRVEHHRAMTPGAATAGFQLVETIPHDLGIVPLVPFDNGHSEITDLMPLCDALNKLLLDMMTASEAAGKPRRWISGLELAERPVLDADGVPVLDADGQPVTEAASPIDDVNTIQTMISESPETKFGQLPASDLSGFREGVQVILSQIMAVSALPSHYLGILTTQPSSADALRASEASLTARAEARQLTFGRSWEQVGRLMLAIDNGVAVEDVSPLRVLWADAATRSVAQEADAVVKLYQAGLLPMAFALAKLGYSDDQIAAIRSAKRAEALDNQGVGVSLTDQQP
jgi:hypothetical protein